MSKKRITALALAACMLTLAACSNEPAPVDTDGADTSATDTTEAAPTHGLPDDLNFKGKNFRIYATPGGYYGHVGENFNYENADVVGQALYDRLAATEDHFGITIDLKYGVEYEIDDVARNSVNSMSDDFDLIVDVAERHVGALYEGLYLPVSDLSYVDLDKPWWNKEYIESVSINPENPYILFGAINHNGVERTVCTFFNIDLLEDRKGVSEQDMYDIVLNGEWTFDKMMELMKGVYTDENGSTTPDAEDIFGLVRWNNFSVNILAFSSGLTFTERDEDGYPTLSLNNERSIELSDKLLSMIINNEDTYNYKDNAGHITFFGEGHAIFMVNRFFVAAWEQIRGSDINYGIIPMPKLDENVENYCSAVHSTTQWQMVPKTEPDTDFASAVIEYLAWYGYEKVIPAYYETSLKFKYTRGDLEGASRMIDLIVESTYTDFLGVNPLNGMENIFMDVVNSGSNTFASKYASMETAANSMLEQYIEALG